MDEERDCETSRKDLFKTVGDQLCNCKNPHDCNCRDQLIQGLEKLGINLIFENRSIKFKKGNKTA
jgi:hypothetical protein